MVWRGAHGASARGGRLVASETLPSDELPPATPAFAVRPDRGPDGRFAKGNGIAKSKRLKAGPRGALAMLEAKGDPARRATVNWGRRYGAHRRAELAQAHGGSISAGVGAIIESAADLMADGRYWRARGIAEGNPDYAKLAAQLMAQARGCERDAWELAAREAETRRAALPEGARSPVHLEAEFQRLVQERAAPSAGSREHYVVDTTAAHDGKKCGAR